jgi:hypothetical protein
VHDQPAVLISPGHWVRDLAVDIQLRQVLGWFGALVAPTNDI